MKTIFTLVATPVAVAAALVTAMAVVPRVEAATYNFEWQGSQNGYSAKGQFSYNDIFQGIVITRDQLSSFNVSFFDTANNLLNSYGIPALTDDFNFNFDSQTNTIIQSGNYNESDFLNSVYGVDLGIDPFSPPPNPPNAYAPPGYNFFTYLDQSGIAKLYLNYVPINPTCNSSSASYPVDCGTNLDQGGELVITSQNLEIPESTSPLSLIILGILAAGLKLGKNWLLFKKDNQ